MSEPIERTDYRAILLSAFERRSSKNPRYSRGAFARDLGLSPQHLSQLISGKLGLSPAMATEVARRLALSEDEHELFLADVEAHHSRSKEGRDRGLTKLSVMKQRSEFLPLDAEEKSELLNWYTLPVHVLYSLPDAEPSATWVASRLGIDVNLAQSALDLLFREGLLMEELESGRWVQTSKLFTVRAQQSTREIRQFYSHMLGKADDAIEGVPPDLRALNVNYLTLTEPMYEALRKTIEDFCLSTIRTTTAADRSGAKLYVMSTQLFPIEAL